MAVTGTTPKAMTISEAANATGLTTSALRYYEQAGLMLEPVDRARSNHRRYTERDLGWVGFLTRLRSTGMPVREIRRYAELARKGDGTAEARRELLVARRERVLGQLDEVRRNLAAIDYKISVYERITSP